jgi:Cellulose binding domain/Fibronectin type III domain
MPAVRPSSLRRFRLHLSIAAAAAAATLTAMIGMAGAGAAAPQAAADTPTPSTPGNSTPAPGGSTPNTSPFPPGAPTNLTATQVTGTSVTLSWTASTPGCCAIAGYDITYLQAFNDVIWSQSIGNVTTVTITANIRSGVEYRFWVSARDVVGHRSNSSGSIAVVTPVASTGDTTPPPAPGNLTATAAVGGAELSWTAPADASDVVGYNVYGFDGWFSSTLLGTTTGTTFRAPGVSGPMPQYYVRSRDAAGNISVASNTARAPTSSSPPGPSNSSPSPSTAPLSCRVTYTNQAQWSNGFVAGITITNTGQTVINGWELTFDLPGNVVITGYWGGTASQVGTAVTIRNPPWAAIIQPGASVSVGIQGMYSGTLAMPTNFRLNGVPCGTG